MSETFPELTTQEGATAHAKRLEAYWHAQGHTNVKWTALPIVGLGAKLGGTGWGVRSNLVNGLPPRVKAARK